MRRFIEVMWETGVRMRCPICEQGALFRDAWHLHRTCPHCHVRFERDQGEEVGGMTISIVTTAIIFLTGYYLIELLTAWPAWLHLAIWSSFAIIFPIKFYRTSRALWVGLLHLGGQIFWDTEPYEEPRSITDILHPDREPDDPTEGR